jgi:hypothetical protein
MFIICSGWRHVLLIALSELNPVLVRCLAVVCWSVVWLFFAGVLLADCYLLGSLLWHSSSLISVPDYLIMCRASISF